MYGKNMARSTMVPNSNAAEMRPIKEKMVSSGIGSGIPKVSRIGGGSVLQQPRVL